MKFDFNLALQNWAQQNSIDCIVHNSLPSTNSWAKEQNFTKPTIVIAIEQTLGRGRGQNTWVAKPNQQLTVSFCFQTQLPIQPVFTAKIGLALAQSLNQAFTTSHFLIKPPNDIYIQQKKLAGLLVEVVSQGAQKQIIVGCGINIFSSPINDSECLANVVTHLNEDNYKSWLGLFWNLLKQSIESCDQLLSQNQKTSINKIIHITKQKSEDFKTIDEFGNLHFKNLTVAWSEL